jgi:hypothetical protein
MTQPDSPLVLRDCTGPVVRLTLNRGDRFNPLSSAMIAMTFIRLRKLERMLPWGLL